MGGAPFTDPRFLLVRRGRALLRGLRMTTLKIDVIQEIKPDAQLNADTPALVALGAWANDIRLRYLGYVGRVALRQSGKLVLLVSLTFFTGAASRRFTDN